MHREWRDAIQEVLNTTGKVWVAKKRFDSFAPVRDNCTVKWLGCAIVGVRQGGGDPSLSPPLSPFLLPLSPCTPLFSLPSSLPSLSPSSLRSSLPLLLPLLPPLLSSPHCMLPWIEEGKEGKEVALHVTW